MTLSQSVVYITFAMFHGRWGKCLFWIVNIVGIYGQNLTSPTTPQNQSTGSPVYNCTGSNLTYTPADLCDGVPVCPLEDDEFICDDGMQCAKRKWIKVTHCRNATSTCIEIDHLCDGTSLCDDETDEKFCDSVTVCEPFCTCSSVGATCDMQGFVSTGESLKLPYTTRILRFSNFPSLDNGLPISAYEHHILTMLNLSSNNITDLGSGNFMNMSALRTLDISRNLIRRMGAAAFLGLDSLVILDLSYNRIVELQSDTFIHLPSVHFLVLGDNLLTSLPDGVFQYQTEMTDLILRRNRLHMIVPGAFVGQNKITGLSFTGNNITELRKGALDGLSNLTWLSFRGNPLSYIEPGAFLKINKLQYLLLAESALTDLHPNMFEGIENLKSLSTDDYRLCCLFDSADVCTVVEKTSLDSCTRLMPNTVLRVFMWILGFGALLGNTMVLVIRLLYKERGGQEQPFFITNLAIADLIMGIFMILIASADAYYGAYYYLYAPNWRTSPLCQFAGILAILSSESSVLLLTVITVDRLTSILFPFSRFRFRYKSSRIFVVFMWVLTIVLAVLPIIVGSFVPNFYGLSDVCVGLPLSLANTQTGKLVFSLELGISVFEISDQGYIQPSWIYSIILFLGFNLVCFLFILICYVIIFFSVRKSAQSVGGKRHTNDSTRDQEIKMAAKMALIVGTDFCCWMPVIIMGLLSQTGAVQLPVNLYAWCAVFILPINASLNPYLYTMVAHFGERKRRLRKQNTENSSMYTYNSTVSGGHSKYGNSVKMGQVNDSKKPNDGDGNKI